MGKRQVRQHQFPETISLFQVRIAGQDETIDTCLPVFLDTRLDLFGVADERWQERPLACVVLRPEATASAGDLRRFLEDRVARWWLPERWAMIDEVPKTSVGKFDKKVLRSRLAEGAIQVVEEGAPPTGQR